MANSKVPLYRPYFSAKEIEIISLALEKEAAVNLNPTTVALYKRIRMIAFKIQNDLMPPALERKQTVEESLGVIESQTSTGSEQKERLETLAMRHFKSKEEAGCEDLKLTEEEIAEGKRLELLEYEIDMGMFS